jgi:hypothetical protein
LLLATLVNRVRQGLAEVAQTSQSE